MPQRIMLGQALLFVCFIFYLVWWYRGYRPGVSVSRVKGLNGALLLLTVLFGIAGIAFSLMSGAVESPRIAPGAILIAGAALYVLLLIVTRVGFHRIVTTELVIIVAWTMLETWVITCLNALGALSDAGFGIIGGVLGAAFILSMAMYVAYYRMEPMKAFYAAMVPLATGEVCIACLWLLVVL